MEIKVKTTQIYRAINEAETQELIDLNGGDAKAVLGRDDELDFCLHEGTKWDTNVDGWPKVLLGGNPLSSKRPLILALTENITGIDTTENMKATRRWVNIGYPFQAHAAVTKNVRAKIFAMNVELANERINGTAGN